MTGHHNSSSRSAAALKWTITATLVLSIHEQVEIIAWLSETCSRKYILALCGGVFYSASFKYSFVNERKCLFSPSSVGFMPGSKWLRWALPRKPCIYQAASQVRWCYCLQQVALLFAGGCVGVCTLEPMAHVRTRDAMLACASMFFPACLGARACNIGMRWWSCDLCFNLSAANKNRYDPKDLFPTPSPSPSFHKQAYNSGPSPQELESMIVACMRHDSSYVYMLSVYMASASVPCKLLCKGQAYL
jgi:hypothetical protein